MRLINRTVLMSGAEYFANDAPINPYYTNDSIDVAHAVKEHQAIKAALEEAGVTVISVPAPPTSQDGVYTANWALVRNKKAVLARLPNARKSEEAWAERELTNQGIEVVRVPEEWRFSGQGDALPCGDLLFCGSNYRSDVEAQAFAAKTLGFRQIQLQAVPLRDGNGQAVTNASSGWPDSFYYDIDLALSILKGPSDTQKGLIAYCPEAFIPESRTLLEELDEVDKIVVSEDEARHAFACNLVSTGETVVLSAHAPEFARQLETHGLRTISPRIEELAKGGGYIRCTTLTLE